MVDVISRVFDASGFPPRWSCGDWSPGLGWLHIVSDMGIWGAYLAIPCVLGYFALGRKNLPFRGVFLLFGTFILACGLTHLMDAVMFWWPAYRLSGVLKFVTASLSWATVLALGWVTPRALQMRSPEELEREILERRRAEKEADRYAERLRSTNQRLIEAEREKSNLLANVTHELRTPLTLILSPIETMLEGDRGSLAEADLAKLRIVHNNAVRLLRLVTGVLDLSKLDAGKIEVDREPVELVGLTRSIAGDFQPAMEGRGLMIQTTIELETAWVMLDRYLYEQIVFNLLSNAVKFTPSGGSIGVGLSLAGDRVRLTVADTGIGVAPSDLPSLFQRYHQVDGASTRRFEGTGLGLALVKEFAELLGGTVAVESEQGQGSVFTVEFPAPRREVESEVAANGRPPMRAWRFEPFSQVSTIPEGERPRILVAEDNHELAGHIASLLGEDYTVAVARDGEQALELARDWAPRLILSDVMMPLRDGFELCRALKSDPATSRIPVVLLTALIDREALLKGWEAGADEYLFKPFHPRELLTRVRTLLAAFELRLADRHKDEFVATLAHELRNPLAAIRNCVLVIKSAKSELALVDEFLEIASRQTEHMTRLLDDLMDVSRIRQGKIMLKRQDVDLALLVERAIAARQPALDARQFNVVITLPIPSIRVFADPSRIEQIVGNLIDNAAKYSEDGRRIEVDLRPSGQSAVLSVRDQGMGIPPEMLEQVFDPFVQEGRAPDRASQGVGIGLTLVRKLVELHGGTVEALSEGRGRGSQFVVRLPLAKTDDHPPTQPQAVKPHGPSDHARHRVLVVDDNLDSAKSLSTFLRMVGQEVRSAHDGPAALAQATEFRPDLVLLDISLPGMDGYEVCQVLRNRAEHSNSTIVALTGWCQEDDRRRAIAAGFSRHLVKPVCPETIHELLAKLDESPER